MFKHICIGILLLLFSQTVGAAQLAFVCTKEPCPALKVGTYDIGGEGWRMTFNGDRITITVPYMGFIDPTPPIIDPNIPSIPVQVVVLSSSSTQVKLSWEASTDNVGVVGYKIFKNGKQVGTTKLLVYTNVGLIPNTSYVYTVSAFDAAGNQSAQSIPITVVTKSK